ncbi:hypothetical protein Barb6XT_02781 [Bacteroidales bacterium Barb6XT]|nr:hypothetical protein Barb6XT_02781 [Bacteroidales bacterium Barb6XT]
MQKKYHSPNGTMVMLLFDGAKVCKKMNGQRKMDKNKVIIYQFTVFRDV